MAIAYTKVAAYPDMRKSVYDITLDASYAAGGYALDPKQLGMISVDAVDPFVTTGEGLNPTYVSGTGKLKLFKTGAALSGALAECVAGDITAAIKVRVDVTGTPVL